MKGIISKVKHHSLAESVGITAGEELVGIDGCALRDIIDLSYMQSNPRVELNLIKNGVLRTVIVDKDPDEDLGIEFESAVFDGVKTCHNNCLFCFVDQMIPGMRSGLYVRDDDYRLSFLYGNFVTLTNWTEEDFKRVFSLHLSPLYVSVHATDSDMRCQLMHNRLAGDILSKIKRLADGGINVHTQIVCCPGYNDGKVLEKTFQDLLALYPAVQSVAVVPVGLTKNRGHLSKLRTFTSDEAKEICQNGEKWQKQCREKFGCSFVYFGDEFYLLAGMKIPSSEYYDNFPQLENGIGLTRVFVDEWIKKSEAFDKCIASEPAVIPVGESAYGVLAPLLKKFNAKINGKHKFIAVKNEFFGGAVNVTGLLSGKDLLSKVKQSPRVILPGVVLNKDNLFLDDMTFSEFSRQHGGNVQIAVTAGELLKMLVKD